MKEGQCMLGAQLQTLLQYSIQGTEYILQPKTPQVTIISYFELINTIYIYLVKVNDSCNTLCFHSASMKEFILKNNFVFYPDLLCLSYVVWCVNILMACCTKWLGK